MITPCIRVCRLDPTTHVCIGCNRTKKEIMEWSSYTDDQRKKLMEAISERENDRR